MTESLLRILGEDAFNSNMRAMIPHKAITMTTSILVKMLRNK